MAKIKLNISGEVVEVVGRRFSHYIGNYRFWFGFHKSTDHVAAVQVTHIDSGNRVCFVPHNSRAAALGDDIAAARGELDKLCQRAGTDRVLEVLNGAAKLPTNRKD